MAKPDYTSQDAATYKTNIDTEIGYLYDTGLVSATGDPILKKIDAVGTVVNWIEAENSVSGAGVTLRAEGDGTDTDIDLLLEPKGAGVVGGLANSLGAISTTTGTLKTWSIPSWARLIEIVFDRVSLSGSGTVEILIGGSALETSGYVQGYSKISSSTQVVTNTYTSGFITASAPGGGFAFSGRSILTHVNSTVWQHNGQFHDDNAFFYGSDGIKDTSTTGALTTVGVQPSVGTFDNGQINCYIR